MAKVTWFLVAKEGETVDCILPVYRRKFRHDFLEIKCIKVFQELICIELGVPLVGTILEVEQEFL